MYRRLISGVKGSRTAVHLHAVCRRRSPLQPPAIVFAGAALETKPRGVWYNESTASGRFDPACHLQPASARLSLNPHFAFLLRLFRTPPARVPKLLLWKRYLCKTQTAARRIFEFLSVLSARQLITFVAAAVPAPRRLLHLERLCGNQLCPACRVELLPPAHPQSLLLGKGARNFTAIKSLQLSHSSIYEKTRD